MVGNGDWFLHKPFHNSYTSTMPVPGAKFLKSKLFYPVPRTTPKPHLSFEVLKVTTNGKRTAIKKKISLFQGSNTSVLKEKS